MVLTHTVPPQTVMFVLSLSCTSLLHPSSVPYCPSTPLIPAILFLHCSFILYLVFNVILPSLPPLLIGYSQGSDHPLHQCSTASLSAQTTGPQAQAQSQPFPATPLSLLSPQSMLQVARQLGLQASQRLLQTVSDKYRSYL